RSTPLCRRAFRSRSDLGRPRSLRGRWCFRRRGRSPFARTGETRHCVADRLSPIVLSPRSSLFAKISGPNSERRHFGAGGWVWPRRSLSERIEAYLNGSLASCELDSG